MCTRINCMWIRDNGNERRSNKTESRMTRMTMYVNGRPERRGRGSLTLLHSRRGTFWGISTFSSFMRRIHPWGETLHSYSNIFIIGIMLNRYLESVQIRGIIPWRRTSILSSGCLGGGRINPSSLRFLSMLQQRRRWDMVRDMSSLI